MGEEARCPECCEKDCREKCRQKCCCDRKRDCCDYDFCEDESGNLIWLLILLLIVYCIFCSNNRRGGILGGIF